MAENKPSQEQAKAAMLEQIGHDGHLVENAVSLVVSQAAEIRGLSPSPIDAQFKLVDAMGGKYNDASQAAGRIETLGSVIGNPDLVDAAMQAGIYSSENQRKQLQEARGKGFTELREIALQMSGPTKPGEQLVNLASRISLSIKK